MRRIVLLISLLVALTGCAQVIGLEGVSVRYYIGGQVHGLWDGADGVALRLQAPGTDALLTVTANGGFHFPELFDPGTSYTVTVATNPTQHTCVVDSSGKWMVADASVTSVSITCTGPAVSIALSGPWGFEGGPSLGARGGSHGSRSHGSNRTDRSGGITWIGSRGTNCVQARAALDLPGPTGGPSADTYTRPSAPTRSSMTMP
jgi:uncharacterized protein YceK